MHNQLEVIHSHTVKSVSTNIADVVRTLITIIANDKYIKDLSYSAALNFLSQLVKPINQEKIE